MKEIMSMSESINNQRINEMASWQSKAWQWRIIASIKAGKPGPIQYQWRNQSSEV
jgi:hypothetical protein